MTRLKLKLEFELVGSLRDVSRNSTRLVFGELKLKRLGLTPA
jgi:hypothetical protein